MTPGIEVILDKPANSVAARFMELFRKAAPKWANIVDQYTGNKKVVVVYGPGDPKRLAFLNQHLASGGRIVCWDRGYWERKDSMRLSIDGLHPTKEHLDLYPGTPRRKFVLREDADPNGPIMLVGLGPKSNAAFGYGEMEWERGAFKKILAEFPGTRVKWRPKRLPITMAGTDLSFGSSIEEALKGCSLVVCRHSNVAVDACVAGVPVRCEDGAAFALYNGNQNPTPEERLEFLHKLSWWEWSTSQLHEAWDWITEVLNKTGGGLK